MELLTDEKLMNLLSENGYYLTDDIKESIYILRNGKMISGNFDCGIRSVEHREIAELFIEDEDAISSSFLLQIIIDSVVVCEKRIYVIQGF